MSANGVDGPFFDPRLDRQRRLIRFLRVAGLVVFGLALLSLVLPPQLDAEVSVAMVTLLVAAPVVRVVWLARRWLHKGDLRFAAAALGLLAVVGTGAAIAFVG